MKTFQIFRIFTPAALGLTLLIGGLLATPLPGEAAGKEMVYVFNRGSKDVSVIDPESQRVVRTYPLGVSIRWLSNEQNYWDGRRIWTYTVEKGISYAVVIDPKGFRVVEKIRLGKGPSHGAVLVRGNRFALVNVAGEDHIAVIDTEKMSVVRRIPTGAFPCDLDTSPDGRFVYTPERNQDTVARIDLKTFKVVGRVALEKNNFPHMLRVSPDGRRIWVQNAKKGTNAFIDAKRLRLIKTIQVGKVPVSNGFSPDGRVSYVTNIRDGTFAIVDTKILEVIGRVNVGKAPENLGFTSDGRFAYVAVGGEDAVAVIDARNHRFLKLIPVGKRPSGLLVTDRF